MLLLIAILFMSLKDSAPWWSVQASGSDANLRGVSVVLDAGKNDRLQYVIWASGSDGVILRSVDEGSTWKQISVPNAGGLGFRDIEAFSADEAYVMSSGEGNKSRVYKTTDGGKTWKLQYSGTTPGLFLDSMACDSETHCVALSDPVNGKFVVLNTNDGEHWSELPSDKMPPALAKEGAFAASGTAIVMCDRGGIYFGTGGPAARVFRSLDQGRSWTVSETPIVSGTASSGIFSIACEGPDDLVAVGGDYKNANDDNRVAIYSDDAGATWHLAEAQPGGYRSAVASFSYGDFAAVGPNGTDISHDKGIHWRHTEKLNLNAVAFESTSGWGVGPKGAVARFETHFPYQIRREDGSRVVVGGAR
ncbi:MAG: YCF48-related protein [Candidatus Sulfotelmatobacter sp.]